MWKRSPHATLGGLLHHGVSPILHPLSCRMFPPPARLTVRATSAALRLRRRKGPGSGPCTPGPFFGIIESDLRFQPGHAGADVCANAPRVPGATIARDRAPLRLRKGYVSSSAVSLSWRCHEQAIPVGVAPTLPTVVVPPVHAGSPRVVAEAFVPACLPVPVRTSYCKIYHACAECCADSQPTDAAPALFC
jgi:hypothetical protein